MSQTGNQEREQELKFRFAHRAGFERALEAAELGARGPTRVLTNHYLDSADSRLAGARALLRIRESGGRRALTLKVGTERMPGYFDSEEFEAKISPATARRILDTPAHVYELGVRPVEELRSRFGDMELQMIASVQTTRTKKYLKRFTLEFDRVMFPEGGEDYELEVETASPAAARELILIRLAALGVETQPQRQTKLERLLSRRAGS